MKGSIKEQELREVIGRITPVNQSPSRYGKLIKVNRKTCEFIPVYHSTVSKPDGERKSFKIPLDWAWNAFFY